jgi:hypothetical protein
VKQKTPESFCQAILSLDINHAKALANLVMSLSSFTEAQSVVELSTSPNYHYQYSSINDAINALCHSEKDFETVSQLIRRFCLSFYSSPTAAVYRMNSDSSTLLKLFSPTLKDRSLVHIPNTVISGNKPVSVGYRTSSITLSEDDGWQLTLSMQRIGLEQTATECLLSQLDNLLKDKQLPFKAADLIINRLDRAYGNAQYLSPSHQHQQLVSVVRFRQGQKIWLPKLPKNTLGRPCQYADVPHYLIENSQTKLFKYKEQLREVHQTSIFEITPSQIETMCSVSKKGKKIIHQIYTWNDLLLRTKKGHKMSDKPINLLAIISTDAQTNKKIFQQPLFIAVSGINKNQLSPQDAFCEYQQRYDIEPFFRFNKQKLFLDKLQTCDVQHLDNWLLVVQLAVFLLYLTAQYAPHTCPKWQKYLPKEKVVGTTRLSIAQAKKAAQKLFLTFCKKPFLPKKSKKGKPRQKGQKQVPRTRYDVFKKKKKAPI